MSTITIPLPDEDLDFLRAWTSTQGTSAEEFLARQARNLRENLQKSLHPDVLSAAGVIRSDVEAEKAHRDHLEHKHE